MGNVVNWFKNNLDEYVFIRRNDKYAIHRSDPNHPEGSSASLTTTKTVGFSIKCSEFYLACRNNKIGKVKQLLKTVTLDEIDRLEPNGSTALHAACYHGHTDIVELLLKAGANRAVPNKFDCLPYDEAKTNEIKKLFFRIPNNNRLISCTGSIEWDLIDDDVLGNAAQERQNIKSIYDNVTGTTSINKMFEKIEKNYIGQGLMNFAGIENIRRYFEKATKEEDPKWILTAYTDETAFYKILNQEIAGGASKYQSERRYIIALLSYHPKLNDLSYIGTSYRIIQMNANDIEKYQINSSLMTKSFLSTSIDQKIAAWFLCRQKLVRTPSDQMERCNANGKMIKQWVMCVYNIKHHRTALHIEDSSQYVNEGEVLIMPYSVFQIKKIEQVKALYLSEDILITQIELQECDRYLNIEKHE